MTRWPSPGGGGSKWSPGLLDRAETFTEDPVTVEFLDTSLKAENGRLECMGELTGDDTQKDGSTGSETTWTATWETDLSDSTELTADGSTYEGGVTSVRLNGDEIGTSTGTYDVSGYSGLNTLEIDVYNSYNDTANVRASFALNGVALVGRARVEWPMPDDVAAWDILPYQTTLDGGAVTVWGTDPSTGDRVTGELDEPGDISEVDNSVNVAAEVEVQRELNDQNTALDAVFRRRKVT